MEEKRGEKERGNRVCVAHYRSGLPGQLLQAGEVEEIGEAGVHSADQGKPGQVGGERAGQAGGRKTVDEDDGKGDVQLDRGGLKALRAGDPLVENDQGGSKAGGVPSGREDAAADADKADRDQDRGGDPRRRERLAKEERGKQQDEDRADVVDQRREADVQQTVGPEQGDSVQPQRDPAQKEHRELRADGRTVEAAAQQDDRREQRAADQGAQENDLAALNRDMGDKKPVGAEDQHGQEIDAVRQAPAVGFHALHLLAGLQVCPDSTMRRAL